MAAPIVKSCTLCSTQIIDKRYYRSLTTEASKIYSDILIELNIKRQGFACKFCVNKLNRLIRLDEEIRTKVDVLKSKRSEVVAELKNVITIPPTDSPTKTVPRVKTPVRTPLQPKRTFHNISKSPTPRKVKARRILPLPSSPRPTGVENDGPVPIFSQSTQDRSTKTKSFIEKDFDVKIIVKYGKDYRSRIIHDDTQKALCKAVFNNHGSAYLKLLTKNEKSNVLDFICKEIRHEVCTLCRKEETLFRYENNIKWELILNNIILKAPTIHRVFQSILKKHPTADCGAYKSYLCTALSILLYGRNHQLSQIQHVVGFVLDQCGTTKEAISIMHDMGLSVTPSTLHRKKKNLVKQQEKKVNQVSHEYKEQRELILYGESVMKSNSVFNDKENLCSNNIHKDLNKIAATNLNVEVLPNGCGATISGIEAINLQDSYLKPYSSASVFANSLPLTESKDYIEMSKSSSRMDMSETICSANSETSLVHVCDKYSSDSGIYSIASPEKSMDRLKDKLLKAKSSPVRSIEVLGDNLDLLVSPGEMTIDRQRKSWHWFLTLITEKRITAPELSCSGNMADILLLEAANWLPSDEDILKYHQDLRFHIAKILVKHFTSLHHLEKVLPKFIPHQHMESTRKKTVFHNSDLIDASENSSEGMIRILQRLHDLVVPNCDAIDVCESVVFGGDVLTNERAYGAQIAMFNNRSKFKSLLGVIHRPEGLHRQMNFLLVNTCWMLCFLLELLLSFPFCCQCFWNISTILQGEE